MNLMLFDVHFLLSENCCSGDYITILSSEAVHRYFESHRRLWNDSKPDRAVQVQKNKAKSNRKALQRKVVQVFFTNAYT